MEASDALRWLLARRVREDGDILPASLEVAHDWVATGDSVRVAAERLAPGRGPVTVLRHPPDER